VLPDGVMQHNFFYKNTIFYKNCVILLACVHGRRKDFFQGGAPVDCSESFSRRGTRSGKFVFLQFETRKTAFFAAISENASLLALKPIFVPPPTVPLH